MKPLHEDQIHVPAFLKCCTHIWSDDYGRAEKSGVYDYYNGISEEFNLPLVNHLNFPKSGVIFVGMCHLLEAVLNAMPTSGSYIIVHRTNDRPFTQKMYDCKPKSVKYIYTVDCQVNKSDVSAIPFGVSSINGEDEILKNVINSWDGEDDFNSLGNKRVFACYNTNPDTKHRNDSILFAKESPLVNYQYPNLSQWEFHYQCKAHRFTLALAGCGADASRQWSAMILGSVPIVTDCPEMRHFNDLPLVYCPKDMNEITEEWLDKQDVTGKSTERMRMSYWDSHIKQKRNEYGI